MEWIGNGGLWQKHNYFKLRDTSFSAKRNKNARGQNEISHFELLILLPGKTCLSLLTYRFATQLMSRRCTLKAFSFYVLHNAHLAWLQLIVSVRIIENEISQIRLVSSRVSCIVTAHKYGAVQYRVQYLRSLYEQYLVQRIAPYKVPFVQQSWIKYSVLKLAVYY